METLMASITSDHASLQKPGKEGRKLIPSWEGSEWKEPYQICGYFPRYL